MTDHDDAPTSRLAPILAMGFITSAAMWFVGFVTHLPGVELSGPAVAVPLLAMQFLGCLLAGRLVTKSASITTGIGAGVVSGVINLLVLGSVLASGESEGANALRDNAFAIAITSVAAAGVLGGIAGLVGGKLSSECRCRTLDAGTWHFRFALAAPIAALPTLLSGGIVTSAEAGLAVPDWPASFGSNMFLFSLSKMTGGIYYEHAHRLFGSLTGLTVLSILIYTLARKGVRASAKATAIAAFIAVCVQGVIGGIRVTSAEPTADPAVTADHMGSIALAMTHGVTGQITFALLLVLAAVLSAGWASAPRAERSDGFLRLFSMVLFVTLILQLVLGGGVRHSEMHPKFLHTHLLVSVIVLVAAGLAGFRAIGKFKDVTVLRKLGHATVHSIALQFLLGVAALIVLVMGKDDPENTPAEIILATAHQANGALVLGAGTLLFLWVRRLVPKG